MLMGKRKKKKGMWRQEGRWGDFCFVFYCFFLFLVWVFEENWEPIFLAIMTCVIIIKAKFILVVVVWVCIGAAVPGARTGARASVGM